MYVDIVISNIFNLNKHFLFLFFIFFLCGMSPFFQRHNYSHTFAHNSKTTRSIFVKFWEIATNNMTVTNLK